MSTAIIPFAEVEKMALASAKSAFFAGIGTPEQALVLMLVAQSEGCHPIQAMQRYDVIKGKPAKKAQAMLADFLAAGGTVEWHEHTAQRCKATFSHCRGGTITVEWDIERAKTAGLLSNDTWRKYPEAMLHARTVSSGVRFVYPAATGGLYDPSEVQDFEDRPGKPASVSKLWDKLESNTAPANEHPPAEAQYEDVAPPAEAPPAPVTLAMPGDDCDRVPAEIAHASRKLTVEPFAEMDVETLIRTIGVLDEMARKSKQPKNSAVIQVVATFARAEGKRRAAEVVSA